MASSSSVQQLQRSLLVGLTHSPCTTRSKSSPSAFTTPPSFRRARRRGWRAPMREQFQRRWLTCCPRGPKDLRGSPGLNMVWNIRICSGISGEAFRDGNSRFSGHADNLNATSGFKFASGSVMYLSSSTLHKELSASIGHGAAVIGKRARWPSLASHMEPFTSNNGVVATEDGELPWPGRWWARPDMSKQIFCNRSLNMKSIEAIGFDMDYTLAQYNAETFESLAYTGTIQKLVQNLNYPSELLLWKFDWRFMVRGLVLDKKRGCILKMDRHKYVKVAYHGFRELTREERQARYGNTLSRESYDEPDYALIDTLFSLAEAYLFMQLVDFKDAFPGKIPTGTDYSQLYKDVRAAVDLCHRDGTLKQAVANEPSKYINEDPQMVPMLKMLRRSGRMTFLVTNSLWDYTHVVMNYLCGKCGTNGGIPRDNEWLSYFDVVITGSAKPTFFLDGNRAPLFEVDIHTGMLQNTDSGTPMAQIGGVGLHKTLLPKSMVKQACRVFQGGNVTHLHKLLAIEAGAQVLYVGDHIYGDILRSKKELGWRTMLVVPELGAELEILRQTVSIRKEISKLRSRRDALEDRLHRLEWCLRFEDHTEEEQLRLEQEALLLKRENDDVREQHRLSQRDCHHRFHKTWGQLMKTGYQNSRFSHQVERFACLYTSHVTNLCYYSPNKSYRTTEDFMPHELLGEEL